MVINLPFLFRAQSNLQSQDFKLDYEAMSDTELMENLRGQALALIAELVEMLDETGWKPWSSSNHVHSERALDELVDLFHFFMNLGLIVGAKALMTPEAIGTYIEEGYLKKRQINAQRQTDGYDGVSSKCPNCHRELSEIPPALHALGYCMCGEPINKEIPT